jgi:hypothetical protein
MSTIFSPSDTAPLKSVVNCCAAVNILNILSGGKLDTFGAPTDLLLAVRIGVKVQGPLVPLWLDLPLPPGMCEATAVALCYLRVLPRRTHLGL